MKRTLSTPKEVTFHLHLSSLFRYQKNLPPHTNVRYHKVFSADNNNCFLLIVDPICN